MSDSYVHSFYISVTDIIIYIYQWYHVLKCVTKPTTHLLQRYIIDFQQYFPLFEPIWIGNDGISTKEAKTSAARSIYSRRYQSWVPALWSQNQWIWVRDNQAKGGWGSAPEWQHYNAKPKLNGRCIKVYGARFKTLVPTWEIVSSSTCRAWQCW